MPCRVRRHRAGRDAPMRQGGEAQPRPAQACARAGAALGTLRFAPVPVVDSARSSSRSCRYPIPVCRPLLAGNRVTHGRARARAVHRKFAPPAGGNSLLRATDPGGCRGSPGTTKEPWRLPSQNPAADIEDQTGTRGTARAESLLDPREKVLGQRLPTELLRHGKPPGELRISAPPASDRLRRRHSGCPAYPTDRHALYQPFQNSFPQVGCGFAWPAATARRRCQWWAAVVTGAGVFLRR